jgi:hypothetical protein
VEGEIQVKKIVVCVLATFLVLMTSCAAVIQAQPSYSKPENDWFSMCFRCSYIFGSTDFTDIAKTHSVGELREFYKKTSLAMSSDIVNKVFLNDKRYNDTFFKERFLLLIPVVSGTGSATYKVTEVIEKSSVMRIQIGVYAPELMTADMADWIVVIEADKKFASLGAEVSFEKITADIALSSPPPEALVSVTFAGNQRSNKHYEYLTDLVFHFRGEHEMFNGGMLTNVQLIRDGVVLDGIELYPIQYQQFLSSSLPRDATPLFPSALKRLDLDNYGESSFYVPFPLITPGTYVFSGNYAGVPFKTKPVTIVGRGSSATKQLGLGNFSSTNIVRIQCSQISYLHGTERVWQTSNATVISKTLDYFNKLQGERFDDGNSYGDFSLGIRFELVDGSVFNLHIASFTTGNEASVYHSSLSDINGTILYRISNAKTGAEWETFLAQYERLR